MGYLKGETRCNLKRLYPYASLSLARCGQQSLSLKRREKPHPWQTPTKAGLRVNAGYLALGPPGVRDAAEDGLLGTLVLEC